MLEETSTAAVPKGSPSHDASLLILSNVCDHLLSARLSRILKEVSLSPILPERWYKYKHLSCHDGLEQITRHLKKAYRCYCGSLRTLWFVHTELICFCFSDWHMVHSGLPRVSILDSVLFHIGIMYLFHTSLNPFVLLPGWCDTDCN